MWEGLYRFWISSIYLACIYVAGIFMLAAPAHAGGDDACLDVEFREFTSYGHIAETGLITSKRTHKALLDRFLPERGIDPIYVYVSDVTSNSAGNFEIGKIISDGSQMEIHLSFVRGSSTIGATALNQRVLMFSLEDTCSVSAIIFDGVDKRGRK